MIQRLAECIPWNLFLGFLNVYKYGLSLRRQDDIVWIKKYCLVLRKLKPVLLLQVLKEK
jgi:hypothetical protein